MQTRNCKKKSEFSDKKVAINLFILFNVEKSSVRLFLESLILTDWQQT